VDPCDDFYQFACGGWLDRTVIPADKTAVYRTITIPMDNTDIDLNKILAAYAKGDFSISATYAKKLRDFYVSCTEIDGQVDAATAAVKTRAAALRAYKTPKEFARIIAKLHLEGAGPLFGFGSAQDLDDSTKVIGDFGQGGIALGQRDYYLKTDEKSLEILAHYRAHVAGILELTGATPAQAKAAADTVLRIETKLAKASYALADQGDPSKTHHPVSLSGVKKLAPHFDWDTYMRVLGNKHTKHMNVEEPEFFQALDQLLVNTPKNDLDVYLIWHFVHSVASRLGGEFEKENFAFFRAYLSGAKEPLPRWKLCTQSVEGSLGYALAEAYVKTFNGKAIKAKTEAMIKQIKAAFAADLRDLTHGKEAWMDEASLAKALEKVTAIRQKVGAPEKWRNYDSLQTAKNNYLGNTLAVRRFESKRDVAKIGKPVDHTEWGMMPWDINAYYDRSNNEFNFPFGILQPPALDLDASDGANFGSFGGGTIGHELTHGFDNNGSQYDAKGNVKNWWSGETLKRYQEKTACYVNQANQYTISAVDRTVNGQATLEENLADQGGVKLGYVALEKILSARPESRPWNGKYTERQQYWIGYAQSWCTQMTPEQLRAQMTTDVHPPAEFRVNAVLMNRPEFARDFACKAGARMAPMNRCSVW
jgi:endothelin-converting enzyme/putative endopeptidase